MKIVGPFVSARAVPQTPENLLACSVRLIAGIIIAFDESSGHVLRIFNPLGQGAFVNFCILVNGFEYVNFFIQRRISITERNTHNFIRSLRTLERIETRQRMKLCIHHRESCYSFIASCCTYYDLLVRPLACRQLVEL